MNFNLSALDNDFKNRLIPSLSQLRIKEDPSGVKLLACKAEKASVLRKGEELTVFYNKKY